MLRRLAVSIESKLGTGCVRVGIDGPDAAGKTTLADGLAVMLSERGVVVVRASIDGFHRPAADRHRRAGRDPAASYYEDSFDYESLRHVLLGPLGPSGDRVIRRRVFDYRIDSPVDDPPEEVPPGSVLVFDGVFLLRPETTACWDLSIYLKVQPEATVERARRRDRHLFGAPDEIERRYRERYLPGQARYRAAAHPEERADVLVGNDDPEAPVILRMPEAGPSSPAR
ncbi:MAG: uridine kinase [Actinobacteria bacterium]|nr:uridine kinase [Actinomycetota bacterium]